MSKRLFILGSLLETHPWGAPTQARMWTPVVVEAQIGAEGRCPSRRTAIGHAIGPLAQQRLNEALGFPVGLRPIRSREAVPHRPALTHRRDDTGAIRHRVVGEQPAQADAPPTKPGERALEKRRTGWGISRGEHLGIGQSRRIIDSDVEILPAHLARAPAAIPMNAMPNADHAAEPFQIDVQQVADVRPLIALHGGRRLEQSQAIQADARAARASPSIAAAAGPC